MTHITKNSFDIKLSHAILLTKNTPVDGGVAPVEPVSPTEHFNFLKGTVGLVTKQEKDSGELIQKPRNL